MFKRLVFTLFLIVLLAQLPVFNATAMGEPTGGCAPGFMLHEAMVHDDHDHKHAGTDADQNGDGFICVRHVTPTGKVHVHVDNNVH